MLRSFGNFENENDKQPASSSSGGGIKRMASIGLGELPSATMWVTPLETSPQEKWFLSNPVPELHRWMLGVVISSGFSCTLSLRVQIASPELWEGQGHSSA